MLSCKGITQKIESDEFGEGRVEGASRGPVPSALVPPLPALRGATAGHRRCGPKSVGTATHLLPRAFVGRGGRRYYLFDHAKLGGSERVHIRQVLVEEQEEFYPPSGKTGSPKPGLSVRACHKSQHPLRA